MVLVVVVEVKELRVVYVEIRGLNGGLRPFRGRLKRRKRDAGEGMDNSRGDREPIGAIEL